MIDSMQKALIRKDIKSVTANKRLLSVLLIVPLVLTLFVPTVFILTVVFLPTETEDFQALLEMLPMNGPPGDVRDVVVGLILNNIMPVFFLLIPIMAASVMAASSFVGEKEKRTLETLLYSPLSIAKIFRAKILASFLLSMATSVLSFALMILVVEIELQLALGRMIPPDASWLALMLLVSPAMSLIAITLIVRGSAKAQTMEESQQRSVFLILPVVLLVAGQFTGLFLVDLWVLLAMGVLLGLIALLTLKGAAGKFTYEHLLR